MICKPCGVAGDIVAVARDEFQVGEALNIEGLAVGTRVTLRTVASLYHGLCKGSQHCDCQHKIDFEGKAIRK